MEWISLKNGLSLFRKPLDVPLACALDISDNKLQRTELNRCHCIERNIQKNKGPLKEGVRGVR